MGISNKVLVALAAVLGLGILAKREDVGVGLAGLGTGLGRIGTGLFEVGVAPFKSVGMGLGYAAGGMTAFATSLGDIGRGIAALLGGLKLPDMPSLIGPGYPAPPNGNGIRPNDRNGNGATPGMTKIVNGVWYMWDNLGQGWYWRRLTSI